MKFLGVTILQGVEFPIFPIHFAWALQQQRYCAACDISSKLGMQIDFHLLKLVQSLNLNPEVDFRFYGRHLGKKLIWRHNSAAIRPIMTKFGTQVQNDMPMTTHRSKSKPEVKCQYGGRPSSETGSSVNSAVDWDISPKFGMQIDIHLLNRV